MSEQERLFEGWRWGISLAVAFVAMALGVVGLVLPSGRSTAAEGTTGGGPEVVVAVTLGDLYVEPDRIEVPAGGTLVLDVTNEGAMPHDLKLDGTVGTELLQPGASERIRWTGVTADGQAWCTVPGHREAGMVLDIVVTGGDEHATAGHAPGAAAPGAPAADTSAATIDPKAVPAPDWVPFDPTLAPAPGGTEHVVTLEASEDVLEVAPGVTQELWTFGGQVPGPVLRGKVGDVFTVTLVNKGKIGHSIDFHASKVAWNDEMRTIAPGESLVYQFVAEHAGIFMYHCGTSPALHHIGNGMFGALVIDPPELAPVDHEFVLVQSELYLGPQGAPGDLAKMTSEAWDAVVFNGYVQQYAHRPIRVEAGERIRVWVLDAGPNENSAFHVVGTVFDTVWKEGTYLLQPDERRGGAQVLDLQPAQGGFVEFDFAEDGLYPIVTHKFANVGKGALGLFQAGDVAPTAAGH